MIDQSTLDHLARLMYGLRVKEGSSAACGLTVREAELLIDQARRAVELEGLVRHCWVHSGYRDCGYFQMDTPMKRLYAETIGCDDDEYVLPADRPGEGR